MKIGEEYTLTPRAMAQGGDAVGRISGMACFVSGALPGETVNVKITHVTNTYARGTVVNVLTPAPERVAPRVANAPNMEWQYIASEAQLEFKRQILAEQLTYLGKLSDLPEITAVAGSDSWHYRNSARLHGYGTHLGYRGEKSAHVIVVADDPLLQPALQLAVQHLREATLLHPPEPRTPWSVSLRLSETNGQIVAAISDLPNRIAIAIRDAWLRKSPNVIGVLMPYGVHEGEEAIQETHYGITMNLGATTFFQVSLSAAKTLCDAVLAGLGDDISEWRIVDAFCGAGTFTLPLAQRAKRVIGIEEYAPAVASGQQNAWTNGLENVEWYTEPVERGIAHVLEADAIVLDPPRRGCHPETIMGILRLMPKKVVYVSCHPGTLARDLQLIVAGGYKVTAITCVDCFPQTAHVESVTVLERI